MSKKFNFSFDLSSLSTYTNELDPALILEKMFQEESLKSFSKYLTNAGTNKLNVPDITTYLQDGGTCSLSVSGNTAFSQQTLTAKPVSIVKSYCGKDFLNYWQSQFMTDTITGDEIPFEEKIMEAEMLKIAKLNEKAIWQSVDGGATANLDIFDGLIEVLSGQSCGQATGTTGGLVSGITSSNIDDQIDEFMSTVSEDILGEDLVLYMSIANFNKAVQAYSSTLTSNPLYQKETGNYEFKHPIYSNLTVKGVYGLSGTDKMVLTFKENIYAAVAANGDEIKVEWSKGAGLDKNWYLTVDYLMGVQVGRPEYVVTNFITA